MNNDNIRINFEISKRQLRRGLMFAGAIALAVPTYVVAQSAGLSALVASRGDTNHDSNVDNSEAKDALYTLATELHNAQSTPSFARARGLSAAPTASDCTVAGEQLVHGADLYVCTGAGASPSRIRTCPQGQTLDTNNNCVSPPPPPGSCSSDGATGCVSNSSFRAAATSGLAGKVVSGQTVAGASGTARVTCWKDGFCSARHGLSRPAPAPGECQNQFNKGVRAAAYRPSSSTSGWWGNDGGHRECN